MRYLSETRTRKPTLAAAGSAARRVARRGGRLRIPAPTPLPLFGARVSFLPIPSASGCAGQLGEHSTESRILTASAWGVERRAEILRGSDSARGRRGAEFVSKKEV